MTSEIRIQADDFFKAYQVLYKNRNTASLAIMGPGIVCLSFSVELYLKDLHVILKGKGPRVHDILKLFDQLPTQVKQEIFAHKAISLNPFTTRGDMFSPQFYSDNYSLYDRFRDQIKTISNGFEKWRYSYESNTLNYQTYFALAFIEAVKATADSKRKDLQKFS